MIILRHEPDVDVDWGCTHYAEIVGTVLSEARRRPEALGSLQASALAWAGYVAVRDTDAMELDRALRLAAQAGLALFRLAAGQGTMGVVLGDGPPARLHATGPTPLAGPDAFRLAFVTAAIARDAAALDALATVSQSVLAAYAAEAAQLLYARALQALCLRRAEARALAEAAIVAAHPSRLRHITPERAQYELVPELEIVRALAAGDTRDFNQRMARALEAHKRLRGRGDDRNDPRHFLALGPLGLAAFADLRGVRVEVQSDYMPLRLIKGEVDRAPFEDDEQPSGRFLLCRYCGSPVGRRSRSCSACLSDLAHAEPLVLTNAELASMERRPCRVCAEPMLPIAFVCPRCREWQTEPEEELALDASMRPFPPQYHVFLLSRSPEPARLAATLAGAPSPEHALARLRDAGVHVTAGPPAASPTGWALDVDVAGDASHRPVSARLTLEAPPPGAPDGARSLLSVALRWDRDVLAELHRHLRLLAALAPDAVAVLDLDARRERPAAWLRQAAWSPVPPEPSELYAIHAVSSPDGRRAWLRTEGLPRLGLFELEMLDVPGDAVDLFTALLDATARRLVERDDRPLEEQPFTVGDGVHVVWVPSAWAIDDAGPHAFGADPALRGDDRPLSAALLAASPDDGGGRRPIATLAATLQRRPRLYESRLTAERGRRLAAHALERLRALRAAHAGDPSWQFCARLRVGDGEDSEDLWCRVHGLGADDIDAEVIAAPTRARGVERGHRSRWALHRVVDWSVEMPGGRITPADVLDEQIRAWRDGGAAPPLVTVPTDDSGALPTMEMPYEPTDPGDRRLDRTDPGFEDDDRTEPAEPPTEPDGMQPAESSFEPTETIGPPPPPRVGAADTEPLWPGVAPPPDITPPPAPPRAASPKPAPPRPASVIDTVIPDEPAPPPAPWVVAAASLLVPGLGQAWLGDRRRGALVFGAALLTAGLCGVLNAWAAYDAYVRAHEPEPPR